MTRRRRRTRGRPLERGARVAGRLALAAPFVVLGYEAAAEPGGRVALAAASRVPRPHAAVRLNGVAMTVGGVAVASGVLPRTAAVGLAASLVPTTVVGHAYWRAEDPVTRKADRIHLLKNLGLAGGLLLLAAGVPGRRGRAA